MEHHVSPARAGIGLALSIVAAVAGCSSEDPTPERSAKSEAPLSAPARRARTDQIRAAAAARGVTNGLLVAGIASHESNLAQCWSELTWSCPGPYSPDCGGPVMTGAGDGPCSAQQGGIGMFQLDSGTWWQTLAEHGNGILDVAGNVAVGTDFILEKVRVCPNTPSFGSHQAVVDWVNGATPGTADYETFMTAMAWCYNGCAPSYTSCNHAAVRAAYKNATQGLLDEMGWDYWYASEASSSSSSSSSAAAAGARVASDADARLEAFARGADGAVWHAWQSSPNGPFGAWSSLGGSIAGDPIAARDADGRLEVFAVDGAGALVQKWQLAPNGGWYEGWLQAGSPGAAIAGEPAVAPNADGRLETYVRTKNGSIAHRWQLAPNGGWSDWSDAGGSATDGPTLATNADGRLEAFVRGGDGAVWSRWQTAPSSGWSAWGRIGGVIVGAPRAARDANGHLVVFVRGADRAIWFAVQGDAGWSDFARIAGGAVDAARVGVDRGRARLRRAREPRRLRRPPLDRALDRRPRRALRARVGRLGRARVAARRGGLERMGNDRRIRAVVLTW